MNEELLILFECMVINSMLNLWRLVLSFLWNVTALPLDLLLWSEMIQIHLRYLHYLWTFVEKVITKTPFKGPPTSRNVPFIGNVTFERSISNKPQDKHQSMDDPNVFILFNVFLFLSESPPLQRSQILKREK